MHLPIYESVVRDLGTPDHGWLPARTADTGRETSRQCTLREFFERERIGGMVFHPDTAAKMLSWVVDA